MHATRRRSGRHLLLAILAVWCAAAHADGDPPRPVDFVRDVRPILSARCFACHGPDAEARRADLSLVDFESATRELAPGVAAVVPGDVEASELWLRITDLDDPMPPASAHDPLDAEEIEIIRRWIEAGASYAPHWAYESPRRRTAEPPADRRDTIDRWLQARFDREGIEPSPPADDLTLLRRLSLDLGGLPPTPEEIEAFRADSSDDRVERVVDRLLASHHFGERLAVHWLDLVRYADTVGYHGDQEHRVWPYRDWVVRAFNRNLPFDRFTRMQLAGDLLPGAGQDELVASAYNRLLQTTHEGGLQLEEYRVIYMVDRVRNASEVWMGATIGCAQCHDHKYDPYTLADFYRFGAFFADIDDEEHLRNPYNGYNTTPTRREPEMRVTTPDSRSETTALEARIARILVSDMERRRELETTDPAWERALARSISLDENRSEPWVDDEADTGGEISGRWDFQALEGILPASGSRYRVQRSDGRVQHYTVNTERRVVVEPGSTLTAFVRFEAATAPDAIMLQVHASGSWEHRAVWGSDAIDYGRTAPDVDTASYRRRGPLPPPGTWHRLEIPLQAMGLAPGAVIDGIAFTQHGGTVLWDAVTIEHDGPCPPDVAAAIAVAPDRRTDDQRAAVRRHRAMTDPVLRDLETRRRSADARLAAIESDLPLMVFTRALDRPRDVRILPRGDWLETDGAIVTPGVPGFLGDVAPRDPTAERLDRLDLANWLLAEDAQGGIAGLTARVFVNRIWALLHGTGLCPSLDDFGGQGRPPEHPELLDELALDFIDSGWDVKALFKRLVTTETYARSSTPTPSAARIDPENLLFARQARPRLAAEFVRDAALQASGLLVDRLGGPSVKPPQPAGHYRHLNFPMRRYAADPDDNQWRRGVYHHWQRQFLHPMLRAFDAPNRESCTAERITSNTPLAALVLLNDPVFVEAARAMAARLLRSHPREGPEADSARLDLGWRLATSRDPDDDERSVLAGLLAAARRHFAERPEDAIELLGVGTADRGCDATDVELAAWTQACRALLNLHETYTRD